MRHRGVTGLGLIILLVLAFPFSHQVYSSPGYPVIEDITETTHASGTTHTTNYPATVDIGDLLIAVFTCDDNEVVTFPNEGTDWHTIYNEDAGNSGPTLAVAWREAIGDEDGTTFDITTGGSEGSCAYVFRITSADDPDNQAPQASLEAFGINTINPDSLSLAPTGGSKEYLWISAEGNDDDDDTTGYPSNMADNNQFAQVASVTLGIASEEVTTDAFDPAQFTLANGEQWEAVTIAVHPIDLGGEDYYRYPTLGVSFSSNVDRSWVTARTATQAIMMASDALREWATERTATQVITMASNAIGERARAYVRDVTLSISSSLESSRLWVTARTATQAITMASNAIGELISGGVDYFRTATLSISSSLESSRIWDLRRLILQNIQIVTEVDRAWSHTVKIAQALTSIFSGSGTYGHIIPIIHSGARWSGTQTARDYSVAIENSIPYPNPIQFLSNRYDPEIALIISPVDTDEIGRARVLVVFITVNLVSGKEKITYDESVTISGEPVKLEFSPKLRFSRGLVDFSENYYTMTVMTTDLVGSETYNEFIIVAPKNFTVLRSSIIIIAIIYIATEILFPNKD